MWIEARDVDGPSGMDEEASAPHDPDVPDPRSAPTEEHQVSWSSPTSRHRPAESKLLVRIPRQRDIERVEDLLGESRAIEPERGPSSPEIGNAFEPSQ
jgi:hypothetical protein